MKRLRFKNKAKKTKDPTCIRNYKKQRNLCCEPKQRGKFEKINPGMRPCGEVKICK